MNEMATRKGQGGAWRKAKQPTLKVLIDMDSVLCDWEGDLLRNYREKYPNSPFIALEDRRTFYAADQYEDLGEEYAEQCRTIHNEEGFYKNLSTIENALEMFREISDLENTDVFICTSQPSKSYHCTKEKMEWVEAHLGRNWVDRMIITRDKTMVAGDILIDDRPKILGAIDRPSWDHILFSACHNNHLDIRRLRCKGRLDSWSDREALMGFLDKARQKLE